MKTKAYTDRFSNKSRLDLLAFITPIIAEDKKAVIFANKSDREKIKILFLDFHRIESKHLLLLPIPKSVIGANNAGRGCSYSGVVIFDNGNDSLIDTLAKSVAGNKSAEIILVKELTKEHYEEAGEAV